MDVETALDRLPEVYALALRLRLRGTGDEEICRAVGVAPEALDTLILIAQQKLANELQD